MTEQSRGVEERLRRYRRIYMESAWMYWRPFRKLNPLETIVLLSCFTFFGGLLVDSLNYAFAGGTLSLTKVTFNFTACKTRHLYRCKLVSVYWSAEMLTEVLDIPVNSVTVTPFNFKLNPKYFWTKKANTGVMSFVIRGQFTTDERPSPNQGETSYLYLEVRYKVSR